MVAAVVEGGGRGGWSRSQRRPESKGKKAGECSDGAVGGARGERVGSAIVFPAIWRLV